MRLFLVLVGDGLGAKEREERDRARLGRERSKKKAKKGFVSSFFVFAATERALLQLASLSLPLLSSSSFLSRSLLLPLTLNDSVMGSGLTARDVSVTARVGDFHSGDGEGDRAAAAASEAASGATVAMPLEAWAASLPGTCGAVFRFRLVFVFVSRKIIVSACVLGRLARQRGKGKGRTEFEFFSTSKAGGRALSKRGGPAGASLAFFFFLPRPSLFQFSLVPRSLATLLNSLCSSQLNKAGIARSKCAKRRRGDVEREEREREKELEPQVAWGASRELTRKA